MTGSVSTRLQPRVTMADLASLCWQTTLVVFTHGNALFGVLTTI